MINVMHIITRLDMGGSAQNTLDTCLRLDRRKYAVTLIHGLSRESEMTAEEQSQVGRRIERARRQGVCIIPMASLVRRIHVFKDIRAFLQIRRKIRQIKPDIVHTHTSKAGLLGRVAAWLEAVPIVVQTPHGHVFYGHFGPAASRFYLLLERLTAVITDRLVALTEQERSDYVRYSVIPESKLTTIHSGVDVGRFQQPIEPMADKSSQPVFPPGRTVIGFVGWLLPIKGVDILLQAMTTVCQSAPQAMLVLVGKGQLEARMKSEVRRLNLAENVQFLGWREDIENILPLFDIFVLPSLNEGMGRVLVEAMAAARPIVASNTGGIPDLIQHQMNGLLVPPGDPRALARALLQLIRQPDAARRMGQAGHRLAGRFSVEEMVDRIEQMYTELLLDKNLHNRLTQATPQGLPGR